MAIRDYVNTKEDLNFDKIKYRQWFYYQCERCKNIDDQQYSGKNNIKKLCRKCIKKDSIEKTKKTNMLRYGVTNPAKAKVIQEKIKQTNLKKYGVTSPAKNEDIKNKQRKTLKEKYGDTNPGAQANHIKFMKYRSEQSDILELEWLDKDNFRGKYDDNGGPIFYNFKCLKCGNIFQDDFHSREPICRVCNPLFVGKSKIEDDIYDFIKNNYNNGIIIRHDRKILNGKELDFYFPEKNLAIEFNGTWWHGYKFGEEMSLSEFKRKHEWKRIECQKLGIRLLNIDEADYINRPEVFNNFILDCLLERKKIYARDCEFKEIIDKKIAKDFCEKYHVNSWRNSSVAYGLFYKNELICVASFSKHHKYGWECIRLCYKTGISIIGGWEKIQKHFGKQFLHYVNLNYFQGDNKTGCGYRFVFNRTNVVYRNQLQSKENIMKYARKNYMYNDKLSAFQNCLACGGIAIFDCGNDIRIYNN